MEEKDNNKKLQFESSPKERVLHNWNTSQNMPMWRDKRTKFSYLQLSVCWQEAKMAKKNIFLKSKVFLFSVASLMVLLFVSGCATMGSGRIMLRQDLLVNQYDTIKKIVIEEAANNGFYPFPIEVKPSQSNNWKGQLYFSRATPMGTDQLFVNFKSQGDKISVYMYGAGTKANPDAAIKAITVRLSQL